MENEGECAEERERDHPDKVVTKPSPGSRIEHSTFKEPRVVPYRRNTEGGVILGKRENWAETREFLKPLEQF